MLIDAIMRRQARTRLLALMTMLVAAILSWAASAATASPLAQFSRETYAYSSALTTQQEAGRYQVMVLQSTDHAMVAQLKAANPNLKVFMYSDTLDSRASDPGLATCTDYTTDNASHPNWFLLDQNGNRIQSRNYPGNYLMDVGNTAYQQACVSHATSMAKQYGFDGVFFDDLTAYLSWVMPSTATVAAYPTAATWQTAEYSFISYAAPQLHGRGLLVIGNIGGGANVPGLWQQWTTPLDGSEEESWMDSGMTYYWPQEIANAAWSAANGKIAILHSHSLNETGNTYGLASMLLVTQGNEGYSTANANYTSAESWFPEYQTAQSLGAATSASTKLANGVYARAFAGGVVLVNPSGSTQSVALGGGTYSGSGLSSASNATLGPWSGLVLSNDTPGSGLLPGDVVAPGISGKAVVGQALTANAGLWSAGPSPTYSYQWMRCASTSPTSCSVISGATASTHTVQSADAAQYIALTVTGANGAGSASASSAATAQVPTPTFSLVASPASKTVTHGTSAYYTISVRPHNGFTGSVSLSVSGLPSAAHTWFNPATTTNWSTLGVSTTSTGTYSVTVSGTSGGVTSTLPLTLTVN
ncbi:MAG: putative glycoside hydrolase family 15 protein [Actinomycetota bacterium]|nr:putative glycoside hydrolase family 15 protein [Actinomycetota bacterium]